MKIFLQNTVKGLRNFSKSLDRNSILVDKPWALIDSDFEIQKLIFKKNKELIMSKDGQVNMGKWDYLPEAKSLLIDRGKDTILCNEGFIDEAVMILKMDGTNNNFFVLANENIVPDLDAYAYLRNLRRQKLKIVTKNLTDGKNLEILPEDEYSDPEVGNSVTIDAEEISDGVYISKKPRVKYIIKNSIIMSIIHEVIYKTKNGGEIMVEQMDQYSYSKGEQVWVNGIQAEDGEYSVIGGRNIIVKDGKIFKKKLF
ncbi:hypothetical protein [Plebeiibacterium sediminum]|uniref:Uncharacterized protein n=1 Tax=Plebeiibacterium sediminum TaxID=2992112 RepID=A0AAE3M9X1_9BACT|nr:hypothetical protein [Plebeiobacterium sediminum]MCW3789667.1 hypothetical protein [Plebeiobacterium sediminum]